MCTAFSTLQYLNRERVGPIRWQSMWEYGMKHLMYTIEMYDMQLSAGRYILHEHPLSASSWHVPEMTLFMAKWGLERFSAHMCRFGMTTHRGHESALVKNKPRASSPTPST